MEYGFPKGDMFSWHYVVRFSNFQNENRDGNIRDSVFTLTKLRAVALP
jgi:hypothetical protein